MPEEIVVETKTCRCGAKFDITDRDMEFYEKISPVFAHIKYSIPSPNLCVECRLQRRLSFRNERKLYHRKCDLSGNQIISIYSPDKPYKVYNKSDWWSDKWNPLDYGVQYDFTKSFFEQFNKLMLVVPRISLFNTNTENAEYNNYITDSKDCYMSTRVFFNCRELYYCYGMVNNCEECIDTTFAVESSRLYECIDVYKSDNCYYLENSDNCRNCLFSYGLKNCRNCFMCSNLINQEYCIENKKYPKEEYAKHVSNALKGDIISLKSYFSEFKKKALRINMLIFNSENSNGDYIYGSKNCNNCYSVTNGENLKNVYDGLNVASSADCNGVGVNSENCYESINSTRSSNLSFAIFSTDSSYLMYCDSCNNNSSNLFGCVGLQNSHYCILNKQYTKEEYEILVPKIIEHMKKTLEWGEFFPSSISPFGYNETVAMEHFPISEEENTLFKWSEYEKGNGYNGAYYEPLGIDKYNDEIEGKESAENNITELLRGILKCEETQKPFKIIRQELDFYIKHNLPIPRHHPDARHLNRMKFRNPRHLFKRCCDNPDCEEINKEANLNLDDSNSTINPKTGKKGIYFNTTYSPERTEVVFCEKCYNKNIY